jgi:hypothetical protein
VCWSKYGNGVRLDLRRGAKNGRRHSFSKVKRLLKQKNGHGGAHGWGRRGRRWVVSVYRSVRERGLSAGVLVRAALRRRRSGVGELGFLTSCFFLEQQR